MLTIKVLGSGCANCKKLEALAHQAMESMSLEAQIIKVTDLTMSHSPYMVVGDRDASAYTV
jgi:hypothetical protein